jgi:protein-S-isoprenylcysteine O-methyltransferase Ste14/predicted DCC family thiol-disulfide oxidoreductase YuxK
VSTFSLPCREARLASTSWNVFKTLGQAALFWLALLILVPAVIQRAEAAAGLEGFRFASARVRVFGLILLLVFSSLYVASGMTLAIHGRGTPFLLDCPRTLVIAGPYRYVRNPMAISGLAQGAGVGLFVGSPLLLLCVISGLLIGSSLVRPAEEAGLERRFGDAYRRYRRRVRCWRPRLVGYDPEREEALPPLASERTVPPSRLVLLYDGNCSFCRAQVRNLARLARRDAIDALDFQAEGVLAQFPGVPYEACMRNMHLVTPDGRVFFGFEAAVHAVATRPLMGVLAYAYYLPGVRLACDLAYAAIAANRYRLTRRAVAAGQCENGTCHLHFPEADHSPPPVARR